MHNETGNVYTHFAALLAFLALMARHFLLLNLRHHQTADTVVTLLFFGGTITCYALSVYYHLFRCGPYDTYQFAFACDLVGIVACILGSYYAGLWVGFECHPKTRLFYMSLISLQVLPLLYVVGQGSLRRNMRVVVPLFSAVVASGLIPTVHWTLVVDHPLKATLLGGIYGMFLLYAAGIVIYALHVPERWFPGSFDYVGCSHQWWHLFVFAAPLMLYCRAMEVALRHGSVCG